MTKNRYWVLCKIEDMEYKNLKSRKILLALTRLVACLDCYGHINYKGINQSSIVVHELSRTGLDCIGAGWLGFSR